MSSAKKTTDHDIIRDWIEQRDGRLARVSDTADGGGILRVDFGEPDESLEGIEWEDFFRIFDENGLAFLYQEKTDGGQISRFNKFVDRNRD